VQLTSHLHLAPRLGMSGAKPLLPLDKGNFIFFVRRRDYGLRFGVGRRDELVLSSSG